MSQEPPELQAHKHALGRQLAALRDAAEIGQQQLGRRTGYSRSSVAHAEAGRQLLTREFWKTADELVGAGGALLTGYEQVQAAKQQHEARSREAELAKAYAEAQARARALRAAAGPSPICGDGGVGDDAVGNGGVSVPTGQEVVAGRVASVGAELAGLVGALLCSAVLGNPHQAVPAEWRERLYEQLAKFFQEWIDKMNRRELHHFLGWLAAAIAALPVSSVNTDGQERFAKAVASPGRVDDQVIDHIEAMLQHCKRQQDLLGSQAVLHTMLAQRRLVHSMLGECSDEFRPRLLSVYSSMSISVGFYFFDLNDVASAMYYCDKAREAAQQARNTELAVSALCSMSYFAAWQGKAHTSIDFAAAAQSLAGKTDDVLLQVLAAERAGLAYAVDGQYKECMTEFDHAQEKFLSSVGRTSPDSPVYWYHDGLLDSQRSYCLLRLGKPKEAAASADRGLRLFDNSFVGNLAFCTLRLATGRLHSGEVEEAVRVFGDGALLATRYRTARLTGEVKTLRACMQPWQNTLAVKELDERLVAWGLG